MNHMYAEDLVGRSTQRHEKDVFRQISSNGRISYNLCTAQFAVRVQSINIY